MANMKRKPLVLDTSKEGARPGALEEERVDAFLEELDEMRSSGSFDWADDTLRDIYDWCKKAGRYTGKQVVAVNNIRFARQWEELEGF